MLFQSATLIPRRYATLGEKPLLCILAVLSVSKEWKTDSLDPGHTITNPGHSYFEALRRHNRLNSRIQKFPEVMKWLQDIEYPNQHFIDMRYSCSEPDEASYKRWLDSYRRLRVWLQRQATQASTYKTVCRKLQGLG
jgi:hypothetical protein